MAGTSPEMTDASVGQAVASQDIDAVLDLFEPGAVFVDPENGNQLRGHDQIREAVLALFGRQPRIEFAPPTVFVCGDLALVLSGWAMEMTDPQGGTSRRSATATDVMRRQPDGTWRYVIDNPRGTSSA